MPTINTSRDLAGLLADIINWKGKLVDWEIRYSLSGRDWIEFIHADTLEIAIGKFRELHPNGVILSLYSVNVRPGDPKKRPSAAQAKTEPKTKSR